MKYNIYPTDSPSSVFVRHIHPDTANLYLHTQLMSVDNEAETRVNLTQVSHCNR